MIRCPTCNALHSPGEPCPGCLVQLGLERPPEPDRSDRKALLGLGIGLALGLSVSITAIGALATWMGHSALAAGDSHAGVLAAERQALEDERAALEAERDLLHAERERMAVERQRLEEAAFRADRATSAPPSGAERAALAAERAAKEAAARATAERHAAAAAAADASREAERARADAEAASAIALGTACTDLFGLEPRAMLGKLTDRERDCLERGRAGSMGILASRLLLTDAFSAGDADRWAALTEAHMTRFGVEADLAYKLTLHERKRRQWEAVLRWSEEALAHRTDWSGAAYTSRVGTLYEARLEARRALHGVDDPRTRVAAEEVRDWLRAVGRPIPPDLQSP